MSGPIQDQDLAPDEFGVAPIEVREGRHAEVGGLRIMRVLPTKGRRTIGPWCFVDLMSPDDIENPPAMEIGPHPHIGLATVTWLLEGAALHGDSLGTEQLIRPGQLNLMTAGHGIAHAELGVESTAGVGGSGIMGVQMWIAQPEATRHGASRFEHFPSLPGMELEGGEATLLVGGVGDVRSPATVDTATIGMELRLRPAMEVPAEPDFEYAVVPLDRKVKVEDVIVEPGALAIVSPGYERLRIEVDGGDGRAMLLGGAPLGERVQMWWNFVARTREEITEAWRDWQRHNEDRFGPVPSELARIEAPAPSWIRED